MHNTFTGARVRVLMTNPPADQVRAIAFGDMDQPRWRIEGALKRLKHRQHLEAVSGLSQHDVAGERCANVLADNITALMGQATQTYADLLPHRRCQRPHANGSMRAILPRAPGR